MMKSAMQYVIVTTVTCAALSLRADHTTSETTAPKCIHFGTSVIDKFYYGYPERDVCVGDELNKVLAEDAANSENNGSLQPYQINLLSGVPKDRYTAYVLEVYPSSRKAIVLFQNKKSLIDINQLALKADLSKPISLDTPFGIEIKACPQGAQICEGSTFNGSLVSGADNFQYEAKVRKLFSNGVAIIDAISKVDGKTLKTTHVIITSFKIRYMKSPYTEGYQTEPTRAVEVNCVVRYEFPARQIKLCKGDKIASKDNSAFTILNAYEDKVLRVEDINGKIEFVDSKFFNLLK